MFQKGSNEDRLRTKNIKKKRILLTKISATRRGGRPTKERKTLLRRPGVLSERDTHTASVP